jgi:hypothetical protein
VLIVSQTVTRRTKRRVSGLAGVEPPRARRISANIAKLPELLRRSPPVLQCTSASHPAPDRCSQHVTQWAQKATSPGTSNANSLKKAKAGDPWLGVRLSSEASGKGAQVKQVFQGQLPN